MVDHALLKLAHERPELRPLLVPMALGEAPPPAAVVRPYTPPKESRVSRAWVVAGAILGALLTL